MTRFVIAAVIAELVMPALADGADIGPQDARSHIAEVATVCGLVVSAKFAAGTRSQPTFLDFGNPYPNQTFVAVILGTDRAKFGAPETAFRGKRICVTGNITLYRGRPEIILSDPRQIRE